MNLFVTDLDKTFLRSDLSVSSYSRKVWNERVKKGDLLSVATARSLKKSLELLEGLELKIPLITLDGALVATPQMEPIAVNSIDPDLAQEIIKIGLEFDIEPFIVGLENREVLNEKFLYPKRLNRFQKTLIESYKNDSRLRAKEKMAPLKENLKIVYMGEEADMRDLERELKGTLKGAVETKLSADPYIDCHFLTVLHPNGDKSHALEELLEYLEGEVSQVNVFGDSLNDIGMFKKADLAIAVKNALTQVKEEADVILDHTNDEDGVARYLDGHYQQ